jgi:hypothetical protein
MDLGLTLEELGDSSGAKTHYERAYDIYRKNLGEGHRQTKAAQSRLGALRG